MTDKERTEAFNSKVSDKKLPSIEEIFIEVAYALDMGFLAEEVEALISGDVLDDDDQKRK